MTDPMMALSLCLLYNTPGLLCILQNPVQTSPLAKAYPIPRTSVLTPNSGYHNFPVHPLMAFHGHGVILGSELVRELLRGREES